MDEELGAVQAQRRGEPVPRIETQAYKEAKREALLDAGLEPEDEPEPKAIEDMSLSDLEEMTPADHVERIRRERT